MRRALGDNTRRRLAEIMPAVKGGGARAAVLPLSVVLNLLMAKVVLDEVGEARYGVILLVANLAMLLPFADLGIAAPIITEVAAARGGGDTQRLARVLQSSMRALLLSALGLSTIGLALLLTGLWPALLGGAQGGLDLSHAATVSLCLVAAALPFGVGERALIGSDRSHVAVGASLMAPLVSLALVMALRIADASAAWFAVAVPFGLLAANVTNFALASRMAELRLWSHLGTCLGSSRLPAVALRRQAAPMFLLSVATPIALQTDRLILSHRSSGQELTAYTLAYQIYAPGLGVAVAAATALWPITARRRALHQSNAKLWRTASAAFSGLGLGLAAGVVLLGPLVVAWLTGSRGTVPVGVFVAFGALLVCQLAALPSVMLLTTAKGLRVQATLAVVGAAGNVGLSWILAPSLGARGPVVASIVFAVLLQLIPLSLYVLRRALPQEDAARKAGVDVSS